MRLEDLLTTISTRRVVNYNPCVDISDLCLDSRQALSGSLFFAISGNKTDGKRFISDAVNRGACAVMIQEPSGDDESQLTRGIYEKKDEESFYMVPDHIPLIVVPDIRKAMALTSARFYDYPSQKLKVIGVTGTNGKTTTTHIIEAILRANGLRTGIIGTLYVKIKDQTCSTGMTTPESLYIQRYLARMVDEDVDVAILEVSSHALHQDRVYGIEFDGGVFTNLTQDHLDFHKDMEDYFQDKMKLFKMLKSADKGGFAVLNADDVRTPRIIETLKVPYKSYGIYVHPDIRAKDITSDLEGISFVAETKQWDIPVNSDMVGFFNIYNTLAGIGVGLFMKIPPAIIQKGTAHMQNVRGRFEMVDLGQPYGVIVDYAHTPDGIMNVLKSARKITRRKLIIVFGCGGDRDKTKRPLMGEMAGEYADFVILTSDNPRTEDPLSIILEIQPGVERKKKDFIIEPDRRKAIFKAVEMAESGDVVVIAGKGHETYQIFATGTVPFDDVQVAQEAIESLVKPL